MSNTIKIFILAPDRDGALSKAEDILSGLGLQGIADYSIEGDQENVDGKDDNLWKMSFDIHPDWGALMQELNSLSSDLINNWEMDFDGIMLDATEGIVGVFYKNTEPPFKFRVKESQKHERMKAAWWNHFIEQKKFWPHGFTIKRLEKTKPQIWEDSLFWADILMRHGGGSSLPRELERQAPEAYLHLMGNMAGMILQTLVENGIIKPQKNERGTK